MQVFQGMEDVVAVQLCHVVFMCIGSLHIDQL